MKLINTIFQLFNKAVFKNNKPTAVETPQDKSAGMNRISLACYLVPVGEDNHIVVNYEDGTSQHLVVEKDMLVSVINLPPYDRLWPPSLKLTVENKGRNAITFDATPVGGFLHPSTMNGRDIYNFHANSQGYVMVTQTVRNLTPGLNHG